MTGLLPTVAMITTAICNVFIGLNISCVDVIANVIYEYDQTKSFHERGHVTNYLILCLKLVTKIC